MVTAPSILHLRVPGFTVAVERRREPRLAHRPVVVAYPAPRAPILDVSDEARGGGARGGHAGGRRSAGCAGTRRCFRRFRTGTSQPCARAARSSGRTPHPLQRSGGGASRWISPACGGLLGPESDVARRARGALREQGGFGAACGLASNALVSRVASSLASGADAGSFGGGERASLATGAVVAVPPGEEADFPRATSRGPPPRRGPPPPFASSPNSTSVRWASWRLSLVRSWPSSSDGAGQSLFWTARGEEADGLRRDRSSSRVEPRGARSTAHRERDGVGLPSDHTGGRPILSPLMPP